MRAAPCCITPSLLGQADDALHASSLSATHKCCDPASTAGKVFIAAVLLLLLLPQVAESLSRKGTAALRVRTGVLRRTGFYEGHTETLRGAQASSFKV